MTYCDINCTHLLINVNVTCWVNASQCQTPINVTGISLEYNVRMEGWFHSGRRVYFVKSIELGAAIPSALNFFNS